MIVSCPNCNTSYNLPDDKVRAGVKLRCKVCSQVFMLVESSEGLTGAVLPQSSIPQPTSPPDPSSQPVRQEPPREAGRSGPNLSINLGEQKSKSSKVPYFILLLFVLLAAGGYYTWNHTALLNPIKTLVGDLFGGDDAPGDPANSMEELTSNLGFRNLRQYQLVNDKIGEIMVVEGKVANEFEEPREMIRVEVELFNANEQLLLSKSQLAGTQVSTFQLQVLDKEELEQALNNRLEQLTNNSNILPGQTVPFMIVIYNPPEEATDFGIRIIDARRPEADQADQTDQVDQTDQADG